jgi:hypothetical protein
MLLHPTPQDKIDANNLISNNKECILCINVLQNLHRIIEVSESEIIKRKDLKFSSSDTNIENFRYQTPVCMCTVAAVEIKLLLKQPSQDFSL